jgi:hypothetical protein
MAGGLLINSDDMLKRWTNDRFLSTQHMAVNESSESRYAAVFFINPDLDYEISCLPTCCGVDHPPKYVSPISHVVYGFALSPRGQTALRSGGGSVARHHRPEESNVTQVQPESVLELTDCFQEP